VTAINPAHRDARHCPQCGAMGILPLDKPARDRGEFQDPIMICPICEEEFRATGMTWLGVFAVADMTDDEVHEVAIALVEWQDRMSAQASDNRVPTVSDDFGPLDPFGGFR